MGVILSRTAGRTVRREVSMEISGVRISPVTSWPSTSTRSPASSTVVRARSAASASASVAATPARATAHASARYSAPVSTSLKPRRRATSRATVDLPAPAGPSMVITGSRRPVTPRAPRSRTALASSELGSRLSDALEGSFDGAVLAGDEQALETVEGVAEHAQRLAEGLAILLENFPPDDGIGGRDACGVLEATRRHLEEARIHVDHRGDQGIHHEVGQVADGGHRAVVGGGVHEGNSPAHRLPELGDALDGLERCAVGGREDDGGASEEIRAGHREARQVGSGHGMAAHESERPRAAELLGRPHDADLGATHVGEERLRRHRLPDRGELALESGHGGGEENHIGARYAFREIGGHVIDHAFPERGLQALAPAADTDDLPGKRDGSRGLGHRAAEEPEPDDAEPTDHPALTSPSTFLRALTSRRFSSGVPMVTRSVVSMPKLDMGRTMTPSLRRRWKTSLPLRPTSTRMKFAREGTYFTPMAVSSSTRKWRPASFMRRHSRMCESSSRAARAATWASEFTLKGARIRLRSEVQAGSAMA